MGAIAQMEPEIDPRTHGSESDNVKRQLWQQVGAIKLATGVAASLSSQSIRACERIRDQKLYLAEEGYPTFDAFLDKHPDSPMSHDAFRRRVNLIESEGDATFDLLNRLDISLNARKLLRGHIEVQGDEIRVGDESVSVKDEEAIILLIDSLKTRVDQLERTNERGQKEFDRAKRKIGDLSDKLSRTGGGVSPDATPQARALFTVVGSLQVLAQEVSSLDDDQKKEFARICFQRLAEGKTLVEEAMGFTAPKVDLGLDDDETEELIAAQD